LIQLNLLNLDLHDHHPKLIWMCHASTLGRRDGPDLPNIGTERSFGIDGIFPPHHCFPKEIVQPINRRGFFSSGLRFCAAGSVRIG
jgi:hypothetical protein